MRTLLVLALATSAAAQTTILTENFANGIPSYFTVQTGTTTITNGVLTLGSGCLQLSRPNGDAIFSRAQGLSIEADITIKDGSAGDFNIWGLYDTLPNCANGPTNGYYTGWYPAGSDNPTDNIVRVTGGAPGTLLATTPARISANNQYHIKQEFLADGTITTYIN